MSVMAAAAAAQVEHGPAATIVPTTSVGSAWSLSGQVELSLLETGRGVELYRDELGVRLSRRLAGDWRLGLALSRTKRSYEDLRETYFDLGLERTWDVSERVRLVVFGGPSAGSILADDEVLDQGTVFGAHVGFATEILLGKLVLRPEIRHRFLDARHDAFDTSGGSSLGFGLRF
jgi:hypothetical protein